MYKKILGVAAGAVMLLSAGVAFADTVGPIDFENPPYTTGNINGQDGWSKTGSFDVEVVSNTYSIPSFGSQTLRLSDAVTSGSFGDQTFSKPLVNEAGETDALNGGYSGGTRQPHFEAQFDLASTMSTLQAGMHMSVSPDRGDGARMSYLRFEDQADGIHVFFVDVQGITDPANFVETDIATITRAPHTIKFVMDFVDGPSNDVVKIYIDGVLKHTGTSWENYYRFDDESNPGSANPYSRTVDSLLFRESGGNNPGNAGNGFLVDNLTLTSNSGLVTVTIDKYVDGVPATAGNANSSAFPMVSSWNAVNIGAGSGSYALSTSGFNSPNPYEAVTSDMTSGADYTTNEVTTGNDVVGASCADGKPYALAGYTTGDSLAAAAAATPSATVPNFTNIQSNKYVIVWNVTCPQYVHVTIAKFVDGVHADATNANSATFPMQAVYNINAETLGPVSGSDPYTIGPVGNNTPTAYEARTLNFLKGGSYSTFEHTDTSVVGASCSGGKQFALQGYSTGNTLAEAQAAPKSLTAPDFTNIQSDKYVIVWNVKCTPPPTCFVTTGGKGKGFWTNKNGETMMKDNGSLNPELGMLSVNNLVNANGTAFDPTTYAQYKTWNTNATAVNMAYMLSAQLSAVLLSQEAGLVIGAKQVVITDPVLSGITGPGGVITIQALIDAANASLGSNGSTPAGHPARSYQEALKNALEKVAEGAVIQLCSPTMTMTFTAPDSSYYNGTTDAAPLYATGSFSMTWNTVSNTVTGGYYNEVIGPTTYSNNIVGGTVSGNTFNINFDRTIPNVYSFTGVLTLSGNILSGTLDGPYFFTATGTVTP